MAGPPAVQDGTRVAVSYRVTQGLLAGSADRPVPAFQFSALTGAAHRSPQRRRGKSLHPGLRCTAGPLKHSRA
jgi:hypothetical protein